jgi:hypothetical protein
MPDTQNEYSCDQKKNKLKEHEMKKTSFTIGYLLLIAMTSASYGSPTSVELQSAAGSMHAAENATVILLCKEELFDNQQPIANGFLPAIITLNAGNATYKTKYNGSLNTVYKEGIYPAGTRVSGYKWYEISAQSIDDEMLTFSLSYDNALNAWGPGQLIIPGSTTKDFFTTCTAIQDLL